ncbi:46125_t:CDS:2 [Gigaspora margarita]|uniref:46125_t:CDS:1 n=1 Tax=Gigaspora margarita TaxID=4874 RepID=A0ABN7UWB5_GIGMA|nr:46125_t:CDS:2 [Gigaspora margarita]
MSFYELKPHVCPNQSNNSLANQHLLTLQNIQSYFIANNIYSITNQNGNLEELSETSTLMEPEQKTMWRKFKDYLKKIGKNKMDKQELEQEINKLKTNSEQKPTEKKI